MDKDGIMTVYPICAYNGSKGCNGPQGVEIVQECSGPEGGQVFWMLGVSCRQPQQSDCYIERNGMCYTPSYLHLLLPSGVLQYTEVSSRNDWPYIFHDPTFPGHFLCQHFLVQLDTQTWK